MLGYPEDNTPEYLLPKMEGTPVTEPVTYRSLFILDTLGNGTEKGTNGTEKGPKGGAEKSTELDGPIDPFADGLPEVQRRPAIGVLTVHRQGWVQKGLALGNLMKSVCLAPGEVAQVAVIDWQRKTTGTSADTTEQGETVTSEIDQARAVNEVQNAVANEAQSGNSSTTAASASAQAGVSGGGLFFSGSASTAATTTSAMTAQFSTGSRDLAAESSNALTQRTAEKSQALRSRRSTVVREVSEKEAETLSSRVLANYNRRHSLNVEYFEVLQLYEIKTELAGWERCLFVPLEPVDFSELETIKKHKATLHRLFDEWGRHDLLERLVKDADDAAIANRLDAEIKEKEEYIVEEKAKMKRYANDVSVLTTVIPYWHMYKAAESAHPQQREGLKQQAIRLYNTIKNQDKNLSILTGNLLTEEPGKLHKALQDRQSWIDLIVARLELANDEMAELRKKRADMDLTLSEFLNANQLFLSQQIWLRMDSYRIYRMLQGRTIEGKPLSMLVDPHPVGVFGNYLAFRWGFGRDAAQTERDAFEQEYLKADSTVADKAETETVIALPTSGVFAEAVLGRAEAAEIIDDDRLWRWEQSPIPILPPKIADLQSRDRAKGMDLGARDLSSSLAALRAQSLADISHVDKILGQVGKGDMFRNMGGLAEAVSLADKVAAISGEGATEAGKRSAEIHAKILDTFVDVLNSDVGKAAVAEFMLPGSGAAVLASDGGDGKGGGGDGTKAGGVKAVVDPLGKVEADSVE